ncbi:hypothetical protein BGW36DRAFT_433488 [Talaromyces proteolyticus]|uniref:Zn(2)-C6 fungal-type domain-containing protein n=1 Tax=Talaromyces proteolyticus TaxID=1131652 RepID=A0AAD4PRQ8_9EURO|nr:uncharacterized protein BGW36DRAFT_433488 [Talaromyces proteolyticus]KAH8689489.1 hypothetical protein BGW36DRAFT_433488 [Talaromyces proteolyticus]
MPFRRKSCDACFSGRRKCDLAFPVCGRCQRNKKECKYASTPQSHADESDHSSNIYHHRPPSSTTELDLHSWSSDDFAIDFCLNDSRLIGELLTQNIPNMLGELGDVQPVAGTTRSWKWVIRQLKQYPGEFVQHAETPFIHKTFDHGLGGELVRTAFGICAGCVCMNEVNQSMLFAALDIEMANLLDLTVRNSLRADLSRMQAIVLYQIIRLFYGDTKQQAIVEQHHDHIAASALRLLHRANVELDATPATWEIWVLAESIRRTVMIAFLVFSVYSISKHGVCPELPTLSILPVSLKQEFWTSETTYLLHSTEEQIVKYPDFTSLWLASPPRILDPFEKLVLVACKGIEAVEALSCPDSLA